jgi:PAS domain S-box-containing protein
MEGTQDSIPIQQLKALISSGESNEALIQQITELFPALIYVYDADQRKLSYISRKITDLLGYEWEDIGSWNSDLSKLIFEEDQLLVNAELEKYYELEDNSSYSYKCRLNHKQGNFRYFRTVGTILRRNERGSPASLLFMAQDITEEISLEQEKKAARELIEETEKMLKLGIWTWDQVTNKTEWSDGMYELMGYTREDLPVIPPDLFMEQVCSTDKDELNKKISEALGTGKEYRFDFSFFRKDGTRAFITSVGKPVLNVQGQVIKLTGINREISDQYHQNLEYKANKELQKQTEQMLNYGVFVRDLTENTTTWTEGLYEIFDLEKPDKAAIVSDEWYYEHIAEEDREKVRNELKRAINERTSFEIDYAITTNKGNLKIVSTKGAVVLDNNHLPIRIVGNTRDITRVNQVENELQRNVRELNRSNAELEEFAYAASHDLQEPLRKITTFGSRLQNKYSDILNDEGRMYIDRMQAAADNMRILIDNLMELSRVTRSNHPFEKVNLNELMNEAISDMELIIDETGAAIKVDSLPVIEGIGVQIRQMFTNLLGNALKFRKSETTPVINITASKLSRNEKESHFLSPEKNYYKVDISDNGIGFDQEYEQRIFQIFQRLHGKSEYPGSGIGLAICKRIAERHNGVISAKGKEGQGAVFSVILPDKQ